jgi:hypothetical protein
VARLRPEDREDFNDDIRAAIVRTLMEYEMRADGLADDDVTEMEILVGVAPS